MAGSVPTPDTANDRFKRRFGDWYWYSIAGAAALHLVLFAFFPAMSAADMSMDASEMTAVEIPDEIVIPPPPEELARPARPVIATTEIDENITIPSTTLDLQRAALLRAPPTTTRGEGDLADAPRFTPHTVKPELRNRAEVGRLLVRNYPPLLRDAGIGGSPVLWFHIDEAGTVLETRIKVSSGYPDLDEAASKVAGMMRFSPALNGSAKVPVWVELPVVFTAR